MEWKDLGNGLIGAFLNGRQIALAHWASGVGNRVLRVTLSGASISSDFETGAASEKFIIGQLAPAV